MAGKEIVGIIGGGGREAVVAEAYAKSPHVGHEVIIPGHDTAKLVTQGKLIDDPRFRDIKTTEVNKILDIFEELGVTLVDVSQDNAVAAGAVDEARRRGIKVVGPSRAAGQIEWDKIWARHFGFFYDLPQPEFADFDDPAKGIDFLKSQADQRWFIKAAFLAEGKGALPAKNREEAIEKVLDLTKLKGQAGRDFLIEKWLTGDDDSSGEEFSTFILSDGENFEILGSAQDHKRVFDNDEGENTGGMGCSTPPLILDGKFSPGLMEEVKVILRETIWGLQMQRRPYTGVLYLGGMAVRRKGKLTPFIIEWNARWGDPEAQVILPGIKNDWFEVGMAVAQGDIKNLKIETDGLARVVVAGASQGYPGDYSAVKGKQIHGLEQAGKLEGVIIYGAGVKVEDGKHYASGGRLFYIVGEGKNVIEAREKAYRAMDLVKVEGNNLHYRTDIGWRDVDRIKLSPDK